jgi:hypothetical protein
MLVKKYRVMSLMLLVGLFVAGANPSFAKDKDRNEAGRLLTGRVFDQQDTPLPNAVVYLTNPRTRAPIKTYIVGSDGSYRFPALSPNVDYEVYAQFQGKRSDTKTVSQFDNRQQVNINLRVDMK